MEHIEFGSLSDVHPYVRDIAALSDVDYLLKDPTEISSDGALLQAMLLPLVCKRSISGKISLVAGFRSYQLLAIHFGGKPKEKVPVVFLNGGTKEDLREIAQFSAVGVPLTSCLGMRAPKQIGAAIWEMNPVFRNAKRGRPRKDGVVEESGIFQKFFPKISSPSGLARAMGVKADAVLSAIRK